MDNDAVAAVFAEMGDLLAIVGGDPHRARAFRTTAQIIEGLRTPLKDLLLMGQLKSVRGLGDGSIERIRTILQTGTCADHAKLLARLPRELRELLQLRGLGPRHARLAYEHLGVSNLAQLEMAARSGLLARVPGIGPLTVERVLRDLDGRQQAPPRRLLLSEALVVGQALVTWMLDDEATIKAEQTGSARRRKETVGDLDILVASTRPLQSSARFVAFDGVREVLLAGDARASVILDSGVQADLRLVATENWGAGLHYFTGSKPHNIAMRIRANARQLALSELGIWERKLRGRGRGEENRKIAKRLSACTDEHEVFQLLDLPFVPPELREGEGEMEAADRGRLPRLVDMADVMGEPQLRARTRSEATVIGQELTRRGRRWAIWVRSAVDLATADARRRFRRDARQVATDTGLVVWCGVEVAIDDVGEVVSDVFDDDHAFADVDVVIGDASVAIPLDKEAATARLLRVIHGGRVHGVCRVRGRHLPDNPAGVDVDLRPVLLACAQQRVFVEVSGEPDRPDLDARTCRMATEVGALLALTGRPASLADVDRVRFAVWQARRGWVTAAQTITSASAETVAHHLRLVDRGDVAGDDNIHDDDDDNQHEEEPLFQPHRRDELRQRLSAFLMGTDDPELRAVLERNGDNALQAAFAILSGDATG